LVCADSALAFCGGFYIAKSRLSQNFGHAVKIKRGAVLGGAEDEIGEFASPRTVFF